MEELKLLCTQRLQRKHDKGIENRWRLPKLFWIVNIRWWMCSEPASIPLVFKCMRVCRRYRKSTEISYDIVSPNFKYTYRSLDAYARVCAFPYNCMCMKSIVYVQCASLCSCRLFWRMFDSGETRILALNKKQLYLPRAFVFCLMDYSYSRFLDSVQENTNFTQIIFFRFRLYKNISQTIRQKLNNNKKYLLKFIQC